MLLVSSIAQEAPLRQWCADRVSSALPRITSPTSVFNLLTLILISPTPVLHPSVPRWETLGQRTWAFSREPRNQHIWRHNANGANTAGAAAPVTSSLARRQLARYQACTASHRPHYHSKVTTATLPRQRPSNHCLSRRGRTTVVASSQTNCHRRHNPQRTVVTRSNTAQCPPADRVPAARHPAGAE